MGFPKEVAQDRFVKQGGRCACCGKLLVSRNRDLGSQGAWHAHHIDGDTDNNVLSNCAVVCINDPENCHLNVAHSGDFTNGSLALRSAFTLVRISSGVSIETLKRLFGD